MHNWSMIPVGTPVARCSARRVSCARSAAARASAGMPCPSARAAASSSAALDDRPAPTGMVVDTWPLTLCTAMPAARISSATAAG
ncbi:MAG: hypothetical protein EBS48_02135 [Actinobacteria bacterium]|nr:hypothetical protein [Actinomycetota bacterium]